MTTGHDHAAHRHEHHHHGDHAGGPAGHQHDEVDEAGLAELLDLDGVVLHGYLDAVVSWVADAAGPDVRRVADLGAGTGTGTLALARRFPDASVVAVDASAGMLTRLADAAAAAGAGDRVRTLTADLDAGWPDLGELDVVWAALSLHHVAGAEQVMVRAREALRPGGVLAVTEMATPTRYLPDDLGVGRPGLELRLHAALDAQPAPFDRYPDWDDALTRAGFTEVERRTFELTPPRPDPATGRYARAYLSRVRPRVPDDLDADDLAVLDLLLDDASPHSLLRRGDLQVGGRRTGWLARRG
ncbi:class I SAM-dependent methyltransferase [Microlunatus capsulatus]|uniref:SAM-dependent methyltransferase n=1 Tax=Microlunatus capsulatus TaxID=99117 RepID=A0ABS4ZDM2_9ACTN|nr:class I SAM-dependent methyltransferase [Microlunatus capsulatus]MBP2419069.1 SAM-dependent methyltransferase [Microlunatus capsulatus]